MASQSTAPPLRTSLVYFKASSSTRKSSSYQGFPIDIEFDLSKMQNLQSNNKKLKIMMFAAVALFIPAILELQSVISVLELPLS